ncbi:MAG: 30S ribosomal protein bS22 [Nitrospirota bacterium]
MGNVKKWRKKKMSKHKHKKLRKKTKFQRRKNK